jgi:hypothetical protein
MGKIMTEDKILKEDHDNGECVGGCPHCAKDRAEFLQALIQPKGNHCAFYTFKA